MWTATLLRNNICMKGFQKGSIATLLRWKFQPGCVPIFIAKVRHFGQPAFMTHPHLINRGEVTPGITQEEYLQRRRNLVKMACDSFRGVKSVKHHLFVFPSASTVYMTYDIPYPFRQNTDFLYYSGFLEPDSVLLLEAKADSTDGDHTSTLFVPHRDLAKELWDGPRSGSDKALYLTGVDSAFGTLEVEKYLQYYNHNHRDYVLWYDHAKPVHADLHRRIFSRFLGEQRHKCVESPVGLCHQQRAVKSPAEIQLMQKSVEIASQSFVETMKFSKPQVNEAHIWAKMDFECRLRGAEFLAYPPVVAGGSRANIIHYITNNQVVQDQEMVLMDAGCELHGYASDLTRTWPVSCVFTEPQRALYEAVLEVQEACIARCTTGVSLDDLFEAMLDLLGGQLVQLGIVDQDSPGEVRRQMARKLCPHHVGHYLGMDVHDSSTLSRKIKLQPGMVITVEPGLYIRHDEFKVREDFRGIGIRIEDNILITEEGPVNLSASCPKTVEDIQAVMASR